MHKIVIKEIKEFNADNIKLVNKIWDSREKAKQILIESKKNDIYSSEIKEDWQKRVKLSRIENDLYYYFMTILDIEGLDAVTSRLCDAIEFPEPNFNEYESLVERNLNLIKRQENLKRRINLSNTLEHEIEEKNKDIEKKKQVYHEYGDIYKYFTEVEKELYMKVKKICELWIMIASHHTFYQYDEYSDHDSFEKGIRSKVEEFVKSADYQQAVMLENTYHRYDEEKYQKLEDSYEI